MTDKTQAKPEPKPADTAKKKPKAMRKVSARIKAMNRIEALLEGLDAETAFLVTRHAAEAAQIRLNQERENQMKAQEAIFNQD